MVPNLVGSTVAVFLLAVGLLLGHGPVATADSDANPSASSSGDAGGESHPPAITAGDDDIGSPSTASHSESASTAERPTSTLGSGREPGEPAVDAAAHDKDTAKSPSAGAVETRSTDTAETHSTDTAEKYSAGAVETPSTDAIETPSTDAVETPSTDAAETQSPGIGGTLFTGTTDMYPMTDFGTDSTSSSIDSGNSASAPADDTNGSSHDSVAAPVAASAPEVSTAVDASPSATHDASAATVESDVDVPIAPSSDVPASTVPAEPDVAPLADVVPLPAAICITADNCMTVLRAMLTLGAQLVIAPLATVSSWFGTVWYQADPEAAPRLPSQQNTAGSPSASDLASLLMSADSAAVWGPSTIRGGATSTKLGEAVLAEINVRGGVMHADAASSSPMSLPAADRELTRFVRHAIDTLVSSPTLIMLTVAAIPGLGGIIFIIGAGMRIGYRQAKFGFATGSSGLARYVPHGPLGVVRTGHLIAVRPRTRSPRFLEEAA